MPRKPTSVSPIEPRSEDQLVLPFVMPRGRRFVQVDRFAVGSVDHNLELSRKIFRVVFDHVLAGFRKMYGFVDCGQQDPLQGAPLGDLVLDTPPPLGEY